MLIDLRNKIQIKHKNLKKDLENTKNAHYIYSALQYAFGICTITTMLLGTIMSMKRQMPLIYPMELGLIMAFTGFSFASNKTKREMKQIKEVIKTQEQDLKETNEKENVFDIQLNHDYNVANCLFHLNKKKINTYASFKSKKVASACLNNYISNDIIYNYPNVVEDVKEIAKAQSKEKKKIKRL